jgi:hypothetical protein
MPDDAVELRCLVSTLQAALSRAHEQIRERDALAAALNRKVARTLANLAHAEERAAELQRRIDESKAAREARQKALKGAPRHPVGTTPA